jgi:hypothetical protein
MWVEACDWCLEREAREEAEHVELVRQAARWLPRACAGPGCSELVTPKKPWQMFCSSACRLRAHRAERRRPAEV